MTLPDGADQPKRGSRRPDSAPLLVDLPAFIIGGAIAALIGWLIQGGPLDNGLISYIVVFGPASVAFAISRFVLEMFWEQVQAPSDRRWKR